MRPYRTSLQPTSVRIPRDLKHRLEKIANERHQPVSLMIVAIVEEWEKEYRKKKDFEQRETELNRINNR